MLNLKKWNDLTDEPLTLENVKKIYDPLKVYRVQYNHWDPANSINGFWAKTAGYTTYYIQQGTIIFINEETKEEVTAGPGCIVKLPRGDYLFRITSDIRLEFIQVLEWPDGWPKNKDLDI
ncbi:hypothetical protein GJV03_14815 [Acinetobacter sp. RIT698]|jgi:hypothetical protein|uniref:hypothetical protein n=1 Tax=Acinetobacter sp. RIT698 TaxID=2666192 RepID=UPI0012AC5CD3|nr:hypothetical protein [Acinetobacter sp. RIT698]MRT38438.1 hypothetical protein [Acinetobacter sp. RIT698]